MRSFNNLVKMPPFKCINQSRKSTCLAQSLLGGKEQSRDSIPDTVAPELMDEDRLRPSPAVNPCPSGHTTDYLSTTTVTQ